MFQSSFAGLFRREQEEMNFYHTNIARELSWYVSIAFQETPIKSVDERFHEKKNRDNLLKYGSLFLGILVPKTSLLDFCQHKPKGKSLGLVKVH